MPISQAEAQAVTLAFVRDYPGALELAYNFRNDTFELYGRRAAEVPANLKGGYVPKATIHNGRAYRGRVDVPLANANTTADLLLTLRHEVLGHYGTNTFAPAEKRALLDGLIAAREEPSLKPRWEDINRRYAGASLDVRAEEVFALHCESIAPGFHVGQSQVQARGQQSFMETCISRLRPMHVGDLHNIVCMVAGGLHDRSRTQQNFPQINDLLRRDEVMEFENTSTAQAANKTPALIAQDPLFREQIQGLKEVTASINAALGPGALQACFQPGKLLEYAADLGLEFDGRIEVFDDGTRSASLQRSAPGGMTYHVALMLPPNAMQVTAHVALGEGDEVLVESEPMRRDYVLRALDAAVESFDGLQTKVPAMERTLPVANTLISGLFIGPIVRAEEGRVAQKIGRDPDKLVWHDVSKLQGKVPAVGDHAEISYAKGVGHVKGRERAQELAR